MGDLISYRCNNDQAKQRICYNLTQICEVFSALCFSSLFANTVISLSRRTWIHVYHFFFSFSVLIWYSTTERHLIGLLKVSKFALANISTILGYCYNSSYGMIWRQTIIGTFTYLQTTYTFWHRELFVEWMRLPPAPRTLWISWRLMCYPRKPGHVWIA